MSNQRDILPIIPLRAAVVFPGVVLSLELTGDAGTKLAEEIVAGRMPRALLLPVSDEGDAIEGAIGVEVEIKGVDRRRGPSVAVVRGTARRRVVAGLQLAPFRTAEVEPVEETTGQGPEFDALVQHVREGSVKLLTLTEAPRLLVREIEVVDSPARLADRVAAHADLPISENRELLVELDVTARLQKLLGAVERRTASLEAANAPADPKLREQVLRQQLAEIQRELGEEPDAGNEWSQRIADAKLPPEVDAAARRAARRLGNGDGGSPDQGIARTYLEWLLELPWSKRTEDKLDLAAARAMLDADHDGLDKIKQRIVEYLAVRKLNPGKRGPILLFAGPPGVGKTSLGKSIARALGREYVRVSLGGVGDEAEIRGHRRTYIGALPGRIIQGLRRAGTKNPVFVLDEIDKLGSGVRGDPAAALLEVLDPEQNFSFSDHYLELPFDLSEVVFIATANDLGTIPAPLRDRMEILSIAGYSTAEKRRIAGSHLVPKQLGEHGLTPEHLHFAAGALDEIIEGHTREAGVRSLEREIAKVVRGVAVKVAAGETYGTEVGVADLPEYLGPQRFFAELAELEPRPGIATGMAWTPTGGEILFIETTLMPGTGKLVVTGQLGDVMSESVQAALSYVRSHAGELGIAPERFQRHDVHVHLPAGGIPKDGPSAGQAIATALVSLFTGRTVRGDVAITGEISLRGLVLPVGGIASKVLAAHRAGIKRVVLPAKNAKDVAEIPAEARDALEIKLVSRLSETLELALEPAVVDLAALVANGNVPAPAVAQLAA